MGNGTRRFVVATRGPSGLEHVTTSTAA